MTKYDWMQQFRDAEISRTAVDAINSHNLFTPASQAKVDSLLLDKFPPLTKEVRPSTS